jgi:iduronate 2-sulfatase
MSLKFRCGLVTPLGVTAFVLAAGLQVTFADAVKLAGKAHGNRPNVLFIMADDLNNDLRCYGCAAVHSPQIDRLAARGVRFDRAYCNYPVCNASRSSLLSGRLPDTTHIVDNATPPRSVLGDTVFLPEHFRLNGYTTLKVGKIYHTGDKFEDERSWDRDVREDARSKNPAPELLVRHDGPIKIVRARDDEIWDGIVARQAVKWLDEVSRNGKPFFLAVGFRRPHTPYISPEKYFALYDVAKLHPRSGPESHLANVPKLALTYRLGQEAFPTKNSGEMMAAYYASLSFMDAQVGVVLDAVDRLKLWENTVVIFTSDHGYHLGEHGGLWHKMCLFEETARVPLVVAAPGRSKGAVSPRLVELVDLYPSLCDLCGLPAPAGLEGESFVPLLDQPDRPGKTAVLTVVSRGFKVKAAGGKLDPNVMGRSVRTERWRYTVWPDGTSELYDHDADPHEWTNLASDERHLREIAELRALVRRYQAKKP